MNSQPADLGDYFPIRQLSARTQVNTVTLRAWERRYGLLKPQRSTKGHRLYCEQDVATIEKVMALVARGVPIGKVKPLLKENAPQPSEQDNTENWNTSISELFTAVQSFSACKVERLIRQMLSNYPVHVCRECLIEPLLFELAHSDDHGATLSFMESELIRYTLMRVSAKVSKEKCVKAATLIAGNQAPLWRLALMALELTDLDISVYLFSRSFSVTTAIGLAERFKDTDTVFYQDGILKNQEKVLLADALREKERLFLCGTAPMLSNFDHKNRVFEDVKTCIKGLQE